MGNRTRLETIYDMVKEPCVVADIGCDHGLLPITLVRKGKCKKAYACDVNPGPLSRAKQAIEQAGMQELVIPVLSDGIRDVTEDVTTLVIAGMGYDTITTILQDGMHKMSQFQQIVVQCNGHVDEFRRWLSNNHFVIDDERLMKDRHYYQMISMHYDSIGETLSDEQCLFGKFLDSDPLFLPYWTMTYQKKAEILKKLSLDHPNYEITKNTMDMIERKIQ